MGNPIQLNLISVLSDEHKQLLARLFEQEFKNGIVKLARKNVFQVDGQEISLSHSVGLHTDIATKQKMFAVYAHTYSDQFAANGKKELNKENVVGQGSFGTVKKVLGTFVLTEKQLNQNLNPEQVVKIIPEPEINTKNLEQQLEKKFANDNRKAEKIAKKVRELVNEKKELWRKDAEITPRGIAEIYKNVSETTFRTNIHNKKVAAYLMPFFEGRSGRKIIEKLVDDEQARKENNQTINLQTQIINFIKSLNRAISITQAVQNFHQDGFFHGDIKPDNIIIAENDSVAFLIDIDVPNELGKPNLGMIYTVRYAAPEVLTKEAEFYDAKTDIYSLWITLIEVLANDHIKVNNKGVYKLPTIKIPNDVDRDEKAELFSMIKKQALSKKLDDRPTTEEIMQMLVDLREEYLAKLKEHFTNEPDKVTELVKELTPDAKAAEALHAKHEASKPWKVKLNELGGKIAQACLYIEEARNRLIKKTFPGYDLAKNNPIDISQLNSDDKLKYDCFEQMHAELAAQQTQIAAIATNKPDEQRAYRSLYKEKHDSVLAIVNNPVNIEILGKHKNILLGILNGVYKFLSWVFSDNQRRHTLGAISTMTDSAKELWNVAKELRQPSIRR